MARKTGKLLRAMQKAAALAATVAKYAVPVGSRRREVTDHAPLDTPEDAGASYGSNWGPVS